ELAAFHSRSLPCFRPRIAHLRTAGDCCIHPPGRCETIAVTPPIIFPKEVAQKQATPFPRQDLLTARNRFTPDFRGWRLEENLKPKSPPYRGGSAARQNEVARAARTAASCRAPAPAPPSCIAITMRSMQPLLL